MAKSEKEYKQDQRNRDYFSRVIEQKLRPDVLNETKPTLLRLSEEVQERLTAFSAYFDLSKRSKSMLINNFVSEALDRAEATMALAQTIGNNRSEVSRSEINGMALEIILRGGGRKELHELYTAYMDAVADLASRRSDKTVVSGDIELKDLEVFKKLFE